MELCMRAGAYEMTGKLAALFSRSRRLSLVFLINLNPEPAGHLIVLLFSVSRKYNPFQHPLVCFHSPQGQWQRPVLTESGTAFFQGQGVNSSLALSLPGCFAGCGLRYKYPTGN